MTERTLELQPNEAALVLMPGDGDSVQMKVFLDESSGDGPGQFAPVIRALTHLLVERQDIIIQAFQDSLPEAFDIEGMDIFEDVSEEELAEEEAAGPDINKTQGNA
jgi:hypothetical protein